MLSEFTERLRLSGTAEFPKAIQMYHGYRPRVSPQKGSPFTAVEQLETRVLLSGSSFDDNHTGVDVPFDVFTQQEIAAFESVTADSNLSSKTPPAGAADGSHASDVLTFVLDFKESTQPTTTDIFGNKVSTFDVTGYGFSAVDFDTVANAVLAEVDDDYFTELIGTVAGPADQDLEIDFIIGDIGTAPSGITEYYFVQIGEGIDGPHSGGILGVAGGSVVRNSSGTGPNSSIVTGDVVASVFTDAIGTLSNLTPSTALTSGNLGLTTNAIAGTTSHEIGHTLSLSHINKAGSVQPTTGAFPIMGTGAIDLPNNDRISDREFSLSGVDGQNSNATRQHIPQLVNAVGLHSTGGTATDAEYEVRHNPRLQLGDAPLDGYAGSLDDQIEILWQTVPTGMQGNDSFNVSYRLAGAPTWISAGPVTTLDTGVEGRVIHSVEIDGLNFDTDYEYRVEHRRGDAVLLGSYQETFHTRLPAGDDTSYTFVAYGDSAGLSTIDNFRDVQNRINVLDAAPEVDVAFSLLLGDNVYDVGSHPESDARFDPTINPEAAAWIAGHVDYVGFGNHDAGTSNGLPSEQNFSSPIPVAGVTAPAQPLGETPQHNYSFDYGDVHFLTFDTNSLNDASRLDAQLDWVESDLAASTATWNLVFAHHPVAGVPDKNEDPSDNYYQQVVPRLRAAGADMFMVGHSHTYSWTYPLLGQTAGVADFVLDTDKDYAKGAGLIQLVSGAGGRSLRPGDYNQFPFVASGFTTQTTPVVEDGFARIDVTPTQLTVSYLAADDGAVIDSFVITNLPPSPSLSVSIAAASIGEGDGPAATTAIVTRTGDTTNALVVNLSSNDTSEATVPATVTIASGLSTSSPFNIDAVDDTISDGTQTVTILGQANGFTDGTDTVDVTDNDVAPTTFYFSVLNNTVVGGLSVRDEDVIAFNGTDFSLLFDGSDVGLGSFDIDALSVISETEILMSFNTAGTIGGLTMDDSDIVLFTASSLGTVTAGTFSMYLDGSDVGLSSNGEDIDGFQLLSSGNLLISTQGSFRGTGASGSDEDIFEFTPTSLGNTTAGSFSIYFDGSDVGLGGSGSRDIDGFAILNEQLHLTTAGTLSITGAAGNDEDVFIFNPTSLGSATSGSFESALFFDGSLFGIGGTDVNAIDLPGSVGVVDQSPTVNITAPSDGNTLTGNVTITADASDDDAVTQVEFFADGSSIGVDTNASDGWSAVWNSNGVSDGSYSLTATATDSASQTASDSIQVTVNNIDDLPTVSVLQPAEGALLANTVTVTASANDDNGVQQVEFFAGATSIGVDTNSSDGWSVSWDTTAGADGAHVITATATDTASQTGDSSVVNVIVDNTAPVISISGPTAGSTESGTITVSASANDTTSDVTQVEFFVNGNSIGVDTNASDGWSVLWDTTTVTNGTYDLTAEATDTAGNSSTASAVQITVDELPTVSVSQPAEGALLTNTVTVNASANDDNGVTQVEFFTGATSIGVDTNSSDGWSVSWDTTAGADGAHVITATATDTASQTGDSSVVNVIVDNTAPVISILGPTAGSTESGTITVSASANDTTSDVTQVEFFVNGNSIGVDTNVSDGWSVPWDTTTVTNGTYDLTAEATDTAGNSSTASAVQITVDNIVSLQLVTYFSLQNNGSIGGLTIQNEDIIAWDGTSYSLYFDGTPYLSSVSMAAFTILSDTQILMSFNESGSVTNDDSSVVTFDDSDLLLFTATSLGASTSGTFELHFDGSDVGLTRNGEDIDSVSIDPDTGDLLISTRGTHNVPGLRGSDEDVSRFTPTSLGSVTSGSWTAYFDGSDVGLGDSGNEDVDGFAILNDQIYVSTRGNFSVPGISGNDQQIVVFNPTSLGTATAGSYDALPHFDALSNDIRGLDVRIVPGSLTAAVSGSTPASSPVTGRNAGNRSNAFRSQHSDRNQLETRSETVQTTVIPHDEVSAATIQECLPEFVWFHKYTDGSDITKDKTDSENSDSFWHDFSGISNSLQLLRPH